MMDSYLGPLTAFALERPLASVLVAVSAAISLTALYFVLSRRRTPTSTQLQPRKDDSTAALDARTDEVLTILIEKHFVRSIVQSHLSNVAQKPRFTFPEFMTFAVPALISLCMIALLVHNVLNNKEPSTYLTGILTTITGYYFGAAASRAQR